MACDARPVTDGPSITARTAIPGILRNQKVNSSILTDGHARGSATAPGTVTWVTVGESACRQECGAPSSKTDHAA